MELNVKTEERIEERIEERTEEMKISQPLIIHGLVGVGKSYWIQEYAKKRNMILHICRCRKDRTLREGRERLHTLAKRYETSVIWLEGADDLTQEAQAFLRRILETHTSTIQFIIECRDIRKLQEAIRSRCQSLYINPPSKYDILNYYNNNIDHIIADKYCITSDKYINYIMNNMDISWRQIIVTMKLINEFPDLWIQVWAGFETNMSIPLNNINITTCINLGVDPNIIFRRYLNSFELLPDCEEKTLALLDKYNKVIENNGSMWSFIGSLE